MIMLMIVIMIRKNNSNNNNSNNNICVWYNPIHVRDDSILIPSHYNEEGFSTRWWISIIVSGLAARNLIDITFNIHFSCNFLLGARKIDDELKSLWRSGFMRKPPPPLPPRADDLKKFRPILSRSAMVEGDETHHPNRPRPPSGWDAKKTNCFALDPWFGIQKFDPYRARCMIRNRNVAHHSTPKSKKQVIPR